MSRLTQQLALTLEEEARARMAPAQVSSLNPTGHVDSRANSQGPQPLFTKKQVQSAAAKGAPPLEVSYTDKS